MKSFDVAIVGAGPAGSSAAIALSRRGYSVALLDKERFPREKLCGDFLSPTSWPLLEKLGVAKNILSEDHKKITTFRLTGVSGAEAEAPLPARNGDTLYGLGLRRSALDHALLEKVAGENVMIWQEAKLGGLKSDARGWFLKVKRRCAVEELQARMLIGADGRNSWVAHHLGMVNRSAVHGQSIGFQLRLQCSKAEAGKVEIHQFPGGYAGLVGIGGDIMTLCLAVDQAYLQNYRSAAICLESCLSLNPHLKQIIDHSQRIGKVRSTYPVYFPSRRPWGHRVLLVGDAARVNEPVTGEGIYIALKSGEIAAKTVDHAFRKRDFSVEHLRFYERECRRVFRLRRWMNAPIRQLIYRPALLNPLIRFAAKRERFLDALVHRICLPEVVR